MTGMELFETVHKLDQDLQKAMGQGMTREEARTIVQIYYLLQRHRKALQLQRYALDKRGKPHELLDWLFGQFQQLENSVKPALLQFASQHPAGQWMLRQKGIGPVISAGLLADIDIHKAHTVGHIWSYAGLRPFVKTATAETIAAWMRKNDADLKAVCDYFGRNPETVQRVATELYGKLTTQAIASAVAKLPWNARLKLLCWNMGECFVKVSGRPDAFYGEVYRRTKEEEIRRNEAGEFADYAKYMLQSRRWNPATKAVQYYKDGKLPPAQIHARAKRKTVKLFLSHLHHVWRKAEGLPVPKPYAIAILGHAHFIEPPE